MATDHNFKVKKGLHVLGSEGVYLTDTNTRLHEGNGNALRISTGTGYVDLGSMNSSWVHFQANKNIYILPFTHVSVDGHLQPYTDSTRTLGGNTVRWSHTYTDNITVTDDVTIGGTISSGAITSTGAIISTNSGNRFDALSIGDDSDVYLYEGSTNVLNIRTGASGSYKYFTFQTDGDFNTNSGGISTGGTQRITSGGNLTNIGTINTGQGATEVYLMNQNVRSSDSPTFADLTVTGNLNITGDINSYNVTDLDVTDKTITVGAGQTEANSGGSGLIVDGSGASLLWDEADNRFEFNKNIYAPIIYGSGAGITALNASQLTSGTIPDARIPSLNTSKITAGTFADARISSSSVTQHLGGYVTTAYTGFDSRYYTESEMQTYFKRGYIQGESASNLAVGWYTVATNTGNRAIGDFTMWDTDSGDHQGVQFKASHFYGVDNSNDITVLHYAKYSGSPIRYIRIKDGGTYDGAALQVYIDKADNTVSIAITGGNPPIDGWVLKDWIADATDPGDVDNYSSFGERVRVDLDLISNGGQQTSGAVIIGNPSNVLSDTNLSIYQDSSTADQIKFYDGTTRVGEIGTQDTTWLRINNHTSKNIYTPRYIRADSGFFVGNTSTGLTSSGNLIGIGTIGCTTITTTGLTANYNSTPNISLSPTSTGGVINARNSSGTSVVVMDGRGTPFIDVTGNLKTGGNTRIDSSGNLSNIGTISSGAISSTGQLTLTQSSGNNILYINSSGGGNPVIYMEDSNRKWGLFVASSNLHFKDENGSINALILSAGGNSTFAGDMNIGGTGNATVRVRHVEGKDSASANLGPLFLNYASTSDVQIGHSGNLNDLHLYGTLRTGGTGRIDNSGNLNNIGTVSCGVITTSGNINISKGNPVLIINDTTASSNTDQVAYISFQDNGTEEAWVGWGSSGNTDFTITNNIGSVVLNGNGTTRIDDNLDLNGNADISGALDTSGSINIRQGSELRLTAGTNEDIGDIVYRRNDQSEKHRIWDGGSNGLNYRYDGGSSYQFGITTNTTLVKIGGTTVIDSSRNLTNIGTISSGTITTTGDINLTGVSNTADEKIILPRGGHIAFYGDGSLSHAISSMGTDDIRINSYGEVILNLDSNNNQTSAANFRIVKHGGTSSAGTAVFTIDGENGNATFTNNLYIPGAIIHEGDTDTYMQFNGADSWRVFAGNSERLKCDTTGVIINDNSGDMDFRVESNNLSGMLFVDGGTDKVAIGTATAGDMDGRFTVQGASIGSTSGNINVHAVIAGSRHHLDIEEERTANTSDWQNTTYRLGMRVDTTKHQAIEFVSDGSSNEHIDIRAGNRVFNTRFNANGNVGIGTQSPSQKLDVQGTILVNNEIQFVNDAVRIYRSSDELRFRTGSADRSRIDSSGNFMVNKTTIGVANVGSELRADGLMSATRSGANVLYVNRTANDGNIIELRQDNVAIGVIGVNSSDNLYIAGSAGGTHGLYFNDTSVVPTAQGGSPESGTMNLGSTTHKFANLYLSGIASASSLTINGQQVINSSRQMLNLSTITSGAHTINGSQYNPYMTFNVSGVTRGRIGVDDTTTANIYFSNSSSSSSGIGLRIEGYINTNKIIPCYGDGTETNNLTDLGASGSRWKNIYAGSNIYAGADVVAYSSSDERLKDNLKKIQQPIEKIQKISGYEFDWNDNQDTFEGHDIGVVAQEVEKVLPEIVETRENGYKAVKYEKMVALLIEGMKEQQEQIKELQEQVQELSKQK